MATPLKRYHWTMLEVHEPLGFVWVYQGFTEDRSPFNNHIWWMCPRCGEPWLKQVPLNIVIDDKPEPMPSILFREARGPCCGGGGIIAGSVHRAERSDAGLRLYPERILRKEFLRMTEGMG